MIKIPTSEILPLELGGLSGRLLKLEPRTDTDVNLLLVYGVHASLERMYSTAQFHSSYGQVWMPDMPGFGGMDSFYKVGLKPSIESYADYLYTVVKAYKLDKKKLRIFAMSFGFLLATRMLQKHPELSDNIEFVISFVGFGRTADFSLDIFNKFYTKPFLRLASTKTGGALISIFIFNRVSLRILFKLFKYLNHNPKYRHETPEEETGAVEMELDLWTINDARTRFYTYQVLSDFDLTKGTKKIHLPLHDLTTPTDQYLDNQSVSKTLSKLYKDYKSYTVKLELHAPSVIGDEETVSKIYPDEIKELLSQ